ncbi:MAG: helix-turn-helix transcriptional regulator [Clostridia bacterium]|nr:helix-turn-helix transcriptional regulator [Clostridia bacterium]MBQ7114202.1 helix-turn-helix transcriptional regulator [Clostridia bacterium]
MDAEKVGKRIAELRKAQNLTQKELAAKLHITDGAVSKWERGINFPDLSLLEPLAAALHTSVIQLLSLEDATNHEVADALSEISLAEKQHLVKELKNRALINTVIGLVLAAALFTASKIFANHNIYGLSQICTTGMLGPIGTLIGSEIYLIRRLRKLSC